MNTNKEDLRELAAQLYAVVVSSMTGNELQAAVQNLLKITKDKHVRKLLSHRSTSINRYTSIYVHFEFA